MNVYFELEDNTVIVQGNVISVNHCSSYLLTCAKRYWIEDNDRITIHYGIGRRGRPTFNHKEFMWIKLKAKEFGEYFAKV